MQRGGRITEGVGHSNPYLLGVSSSSPVQPSFYPFLSIAPAAFVVCFLPLYRLSLHYTQL